MKSVDYIGITTITITQQMVGQKIGVFTAVETKRDDWNPAKKT
jgi:ribosomal protein S19